MQHSAPTKDPAEASSEQVSQPVQTLVHYPNGKLAVSIDELADVSDSSRSSIYEDIQEGLLVARKRGCRTVILAEDALAWLKSLPRVKPRCDSAGEKSKPASNNASKSPAAKKEEASTA